MRRGRRTTCLLAATIGVGAVTLTACGGPPASGHRPASYDTEVMADTPALCLDGAENATKQTAGAFKATRSHGPGTTSMPNGDPAYLFGGTSQYVEIPDDDRLSVTTTGELTVEAWIRPDTLTFARTASTGYVNWLGKASSTDGGNEWLARMYSRDNSELRANRISGYVFNEDGGFGAGSYFEDKVSPGEWIHYALVINTRDTSPAYPTGYVKIYKDGVLRDQDALEAYRITPANTDAPMRIGGVDARSYFEGAIGKVAVYDSEVSPDRLAAHHRAMHAQHPRGSSAGT
ncbi:LamG domain-containing protein [Streptomyces sp. NPDC059378]|uniref:LamG domain-containing protein n=1 Tax=Streptomyces sp. NPDC059378 TaxID=3346815 RepID=UPI00368DDE81